MTTISEKNIMNKFLKLLKTKCVQSPVQSIHTWSPRGGTLNLFMAFCLSPPSKFAVTQFCR